MIAPEARVALESAVSAVFRAIQPAGQVPWTAMTERDLWYELVCCSLSRRVRYEQAFAASMHLRSVGLDPFGLRSARGFQVRVATELSQYLDPKDQQYRSYRFPNLGAACLARTAEALYGRSMSLGGLLSDAGNSRRARRTLMATAFGVGPKEASLFLRNIGLASDLAILDAHVLRFMFWVGILDTPTVSVQSIKRYEVLEDELRSYACRLGADLGQCDTAVWVVARVARRELGI